MKKIFGIIIAVFALISCSSKATPEAEAPKTAPEVKETKDATPVAKVEAVMTKDATPVAKETKDATPVDMK